MSRANNRPVLYSALEAARLCGVVNQTAINWIKNNHLKAFKTPGGQFRVYPEDLRDFMIKRNIQIPTELRLACGESIIEPNAILIVDDDKALNTVLAKFIAGKIDSLSIYQAFDGFEAGSLMAEKHPAILIIDLDLPGVDGFDLCRRINDAERFGRPEINVITALEDSDAESKVRNLGVNYFMKKPLDLPKIYETVKRIIEK